MSVIRNTVFMCVAAFAMSGQLAAQVPPGGVPIPSFADFGDPDDQFGAEMATEGDWAVITGVLGEAFYVYQRIVGASGESWLRQQRIVPPTLGQAGPGSINLRGNRLLIARAFGNGSVTSGRLYIYERASTSAPFQLSATITPTDPQAGDRFGYGLAQSDTRLFVGASGRDENANLDQGAVYVFNNGPSGWLQEAKLVMADPTTNDRFGFALDFDGQDLLIGARQHRPSAALPAQRGAVYVYRLSGGIWTAVQKMTPPIGETASTQLGFSLRAQSGRAVLLSLNNRVYAAGRDASGVWSYSVLPNPSTAGGFTHADLAGNTIAISAGPSTVATYFESGSGWQLAAELTRPSAAANGGAAVRLAGSRLLVGSPLDDASARALDQGSVLAYTLNNGIATPRQRIWHGSGNVPDYLGEQLAISGDWALASATGADTSLGIDQGAIYFIQRQAGQWRFAQAIDASNELGPSDRGVAMFADLAFVVYRSNLTGGIPNPIVRVLKRGAGSVWLPFCDLLMPANTSDPNTVAASSAGVMLSARSNAGVEQVVSYPLPTSSCGSGAVLANNPTSVNAVNTGFTLNGNIAVVQWRDGTQWFNLDIFENLSGTWTRRQSLIASTTIGFVAEAYVQGDSDGANRFAVVHIVPISTIDSRQDIDLYERPSANAAFALVRTISSPTATNGFSDVRFANGSLFTIDPSIGLNGGIGVFDFSTATREQNLVPAGLSVEDGEISNVAISGADAIIGMRWFNRAQSNHAGQVFMLQFSPALNRMSWQFQPAVNTPMPGRMFEDGFEDRAY